MMSNQLPGKLIPSLLLMLSLNGTNLCFAELTVKKTKFPDKIWQGHNELGHIHQARMLKMEEDTISWRRLLYCTDLQINDTSKAKISYRRYISLNYTLPSRTYKIYAKSSRNKTDKDRNGNLRRLRAVRTKTPVYSDNIYSDFVRTLENKLRKVRNGKSFWTYPFPKYCTVCYCVLYTDGLYSDCSEKFLNKLFSTFDNATIMLNLSHNEIQSVLARAFKGLSIIRLLDLSYNAIDVIEPNSFQDMLNLEILLLHSNAFYLPQIVVKINIFNGLCSLRFLTLHLIANDYLLNDSCLQGRAFKELFRLEVLYLDGYLNISFDANFFNTNLTHVSASGRTGFCGILFLNNDTFLGLSKLVSLNIEQCSISFIDSAAFFPLRNLQILNISNNDVDVESVNNAVSSLVIHNRLTVLNMRVLSFWMDGGRELSARNMVNINALPLKELYMDYNGISFVEYSTFEQGLSNLTILSLRGNHLYIGLFFYVIIDCHPNIEILDAGNQFGYPQTLSEQSHIRRNLIRKPLNFNAYEKERSFTCSLGNTELKQIDKVNLRKLIVTGTKYSRFCISFGNFMTKINYIDYSNNQDLSIRLNCFEDMYDLKFLNLSNSIIISTEEQESVFRDLNSLEVLDISKNSLGDGLLYTEALKVLFLSNLEHLSLSGNRIFYLKPNMLEGCHNLKILDISDNYLTSFNLVLKPMKNLSFINLAKNRIQNIEESVRNVIDAIAQHGGLVLDLSENKLLCSCENIEFLKWILDSKVRFRKRYAYVCSFANGTIVNIKHEVIQSLQAECFPYLPIIIVCTLLISCFLVSTSAKIAYRYRWSIMYMYYMQKIRNSPLKKQHNADTDEFRWDAFLSYDDADATFVGRQMREYLENHHGLRLHIRHRDFPLAEVNAVNISNAVKWSRKTILVLSKQFFRNKWCNFELNMARMESIFSNRSVIIILFLEEIPAEYLSSQVTDLLRECRVLDMPKDEAFMEAFWDQFTNLITEV